MGMRCEHTRTGVRVSLKGQIPPGECGNAGLERGSEGWLLEPAWPALRARQGTVSSPPTPPSGKEKPEYWTSKGPSLRAVLRLPGWDSVRVSCTCCAPGPALTTPSGPPLLIPFPLTAPPGQKACFPKEETGS